VYKTVLLSEPLQIDGVLAPSYVEADVFRGFSQFLQADAEIVSPIMLLAIHFKFCAVHSRIIVPF
jgi:hypothetical protein